MKQAPHQLRSAFIRDHNGTWTCIQAIALEHPSGLMRLTPGTRFARGTMLMGVDMAGWLDERLGEAHGPGTQG